MFTGIIEATGVVRRITARGLVSVIAIDAGSAAEGVKPGDSVAVNGVCLTATAVSGSCLAFEAMQETRTKTTTGMLKPGDKVNLERSLKLGDRISGHFVYGHVDCIGVIRRKAYERGNLCFEIGIPTKSGACLLPKGSIAVDGISLTIAARSAAAFSVYVIPHTVAHTTLEGKRASQKVNVEFDMLAKAGGSGNP